MNHSPGSCFCTGSGIAAAPGWRYQGWAVQLHSARSTWAGARRDRDGLAAPVVQAAVVRSRAEDEAGYAAPIFGLSTPVSNRVPETQMRCMITASLRATATRARLAPRRRAMATPQARNFDAGASTAAGNVSSAPTPPHTAGGGSLSIPDLR